MITTEKRLSELINVVEYAKHLIDSYQFKKFFILDDHDQYVPPKNRDALLRLEKAIINLTQDN